MSITFEQSPLVRDVLSFHCPRWEELPSIELYMDQLTNYINAVYTPLTDPTEDDPLLTKAMVNNYVKMKVVARPVNKKYGRTQQAYLLVICAMKQVLSIPELYALIHIGLEKYPLPTAYNYFCTEIESALRMAFSDESHPTLDTARAPNDVTRLVRRVAQSYACKVYVQKRIQFEQLTRQPEPPRKETAKK